MERIKLIDTIEDLNLFIQSAIHGGLFSLWYEEHREDETHPIPWIDSDIANYLDEELILHRSGDKYISPLYHRLMDAFSEESTSEHVKLKFMDIIINKFALSWNKIWDALTTNYKPLENYDMEQTETPDITKERNTKSNTKITNTNEIDSSQQNVFGFNSSDAVPSTSQEGKNTTTTEGNEDDNNTWEEETETGTRGLTRHGNIGVTTSQQMLLAEVDLRTKTIFTDIVLKDVDSMLCLMVY